VWEVRRRRELANQLLVLWTASGQTMEPGVLAHRHVEEAHVQGEDVSQRNLKPEEEIVKVMEKRSSFARPRLVQKLQALRKVKTSQAHAASKSVLDPLGMPVLTRLSTWEFTQGLPEISMGGQFTKERDKTRSIFTILQVRGTNSVCG